jgi:hypothetical protein
LIFSWPEVAPNFATSYGSRWAARPDLLAASPPGRDVGDVIGLAWNDGGHRGFRHRRATSPQNAEK